MKVFKVRQEAVDEVSAAAAGRSRLSAAPEPGEDGDDETSILEDPLTSRRRVRRKRRSENEGEDTGTAPDSEKAEEEEANQEGEAEECLDKKEEENTPELEAAEEEVKEETEKERLFREIIEATSRDEFDHAMELLRELVCINSIRVDMRSF